MDMPNVRARSKAKKTRPKKQRCNNSRRQRLPVTDHNNNLGSHSSGANMSDCDGQSSDMSPTKSIVRQDTDLPPCVSTGACEHHRDPGSTTTSDDDLPSTGVGESVVAGSRDNTEDDLPSTGVGESVAAGSRDNTEDDLPSTGVGESVAAGSRDNIEDEVDATSNPISSLDRTDIVTCPDTSDAGTAKLQEDVAIRGKLHSPSNACASLGNPHQVPESWHSWPNERKQQLYDQLQEKIEHFRFERTCKVCLSADVARAFRPCGHLCCCAPCAKLMKDCPICRQPVHGAIVVVLPRPRKKALPMDYDLLLQRNDYFGV